MRNRIKPRHIFVFDIKTERKVALPPFCLLRQRRLSAHLKSTHNWIGEEKCIKIKNGSKYHNVYNSLTSADELATSQKYSSV